MVGSRQKFTVQWLITYIGLFHTFSDEKAVELQQPLKGPPIVKANSKDFSGREKCQRWSKEEFKKLRKSEKMMEAVLKGTVPVPCKAPAGRPTETLAEQGGTGSV